MTVVVDASVLVAALVDGGPVGRWAEPWLESRPLIGPELAPAEANNVLRRLELSDEISSLEAASAHADLLRLDIRLFPYAPFAHRVWDLRNNLTSYDAWYVALAEASECPLVTLDRRLERAVGPACEIMTPPVSPAIGESRPRGAENSRTVDRLRWRGGRPFRPETPGA